MRSEIKGSTEQSQGGGNTGTPNATQGKDQEKRNKLVTRRKGPEIVASDAMNSERRRRGRQRRPAFQMLVGVVTEKLLTGEESISFPVTHGQFG